MEERLAACAAAVASGSIQYPVPLHYTVAEAPKGFGFPGAGTNAAHNLPLAGNPHVDSFARQQFNEGARALFVPPEELDEALAALCHHQDQQRPLERDHPLAHRQVDAPALPAEQWHAVGAGQVSPMAALDTAFAAIVQANPQLRPRVGNPDELRSNRMGQTLDLLKHRVFAPEPGLAEAVDGAVITALNEEAVVSAALGNKGGINLVVSYEAFAVKMLGALRQEILFARHQAEAGTPPGWLSVVTVATSHTWENGKNEQSHQDPTLAEALLGEMSDTARVLFPVDANSAAAALRAAYGTHGQFWTLVVSKRPMANRLTGAQAQRLVEEGACVVKACEAPEVLLIAIGAYQLTQALLAADCLDAAGHRTAVTCVVEPGRFRIPRDEREHAFVASDAALQQLFPAVAAARVLVSHMRPEPTLGVLRRIDTGPQRTRALGYVARGGTLDVAGMLFSNRCTWAHVAAEAASALGVDAAQVLRADELAAVRGQGDPRTVMTAE
jgi:phosphoketolase